LMSKRNLASKARQIAFCSTNDYKSIACMEFEGFDV
jgi:hypothetical protein